MMPISRVFQQVPLSPDAEIMLSDTAFHHLVRVLRAEESDSIVIFNGEGGEYDATIVKITKKNILIKVNKFHAKKSESALELYLAQGISRGEKMDYTIQKSVELGVKKIIPLLTERCNIKLDHDKKEKRLQHWRSVVISACEQCGRTQPPEVCIPQPLNTWLEQVEIEHRFILTPHTTEKLFDKKIPLSDRIVVMVGPEGGFSDEEVTLARAKGFEPLQLGPRILRTETAGIAAMTVFQMLYGDMR